MSEVSIPEYYSQWEGAYAASRALDHLRQLQTKPFDTEDSSDHNKMARNAAADHELFQSYVDPEKITSIEPFLLGASRRGVRDESARRQNPYTNEVIGRQLDMPWPMLMGVHFSGGYYPGYTNAQATRVVNILPQKNVQNVRQALVVGRRGIRRIEGLGEGSIRFIEMVAHTIDARIEWPDSTTPEYAAKLYDVIDDVSAKVLYPMGNSRQFTVTDILNMKPSWLDRYLPYDGRKIAKRAALFTEKFNEARRSNT
jgi:hypothetical protein